MYNLSQLLVFFFILSVVSLINMWDLNSFTNMGEYVGFYDTFINMQSTWFYYNSIVWTVQPTIQFIYDNFLTNPMIVWLILVLLVLSLFTFSD